MFPIRLVDGPYDGDECTVADLPDCLRVWGDGLTGGEDPDADVPDAEVYVRVATVRGVWLFQWLTSLTRDLSRDAAGDPVPA